MSWDEGNVGHCSMPAPPLDVELSYVYVAWGTERNRPLYVGKSSSPLSRLGQHGQRTRWFAQAVEFEFYAFPSAIEALEAEARAIIELQPIHNVTGRQHKPLVLGDPTGVQYRGRLTKPRQEFEPELKSIDDIPPQQRVIVARVQNRGRVGSWGDSA